MVKLTPPMGWNSWNTFGENINEKLIMETADKMVEQAENEIIKKNTNKMKRTVPKKFDDKLIKDD